MQVLVVCSANICRSPAAAHVLRGTAAPYLDVSSAGIEAFDGMSACGFTAGHMGYAPESHRSRQVDAELVAEADLIVAADRGHRAALARLAPRARSRTFTLAQAASLAAAVADLVSAGQLPPDAPAMPVGPEARLLWLVAEMDAARGQVPVAPAVIVGLPVDATDPGAGEDLPDPHAMVSDLHPVLIPVVVATAERLADAMLRVVAAEAAVQPSAAEQ